MKAHTLLIPGYALLIFNSASAADFSTADICRAAVSIEMSRPTKSMKVDEPGSEPQISYRRPDGDQFKYRCKIEGDRVIWRTFLNDTKSWGRWRDSDSYGDAVTTFAVKGNNLNLSNDQMGDKQFSNKDF